MDGLFPCAGRSAREVRIMSHQLRNCGLIALAVCAVAFSNSQAQAGGRRTCYYQPGYYGYYSHYGNAWNPMPGTWVAPPAVADSTVASDGRYRYRSGYQAPAPAPVTVVAPAEPVYVAPGEPYYDDRASQPDRPIHFQDRSFEDQNRADRKIRGL